MTPEQAYPWQVGQAVTILCWGNRYGVLITAVEDEGIRGYYGQTGNHRVTPGYANGIVGYFPFKYMGADYAGH